MKTTLLQTIGGTLNLFAQRSATVWRSMIGALFVITALPLISQTALTSAGGLVGHWNFDEDSGPVAADSSGFGNDGQLLDGPSWWRLSWTPPQSALFFDGVDDHVNVGNRPSLNPSDEITLAALVSPYDLSISGEIIAKSNGTDPQYFLRVQAGGKIRFGIGGTVLNGHTTLSPSQWYHVAGTYDGSAMKIYVDGALDAIMGKNGPMHDNGVDVWIGARRFQNPLAFSGVIDDARIFSRALSAGEVQSLVTPGQVVITSPPNGQTFVQYIFDPPLSVVMTAEVSNFSAPVTKVDFFEWDELIGTATQVPYSVSFSNPGFGFHDHITAVATDTLGNAVSSDPNAFWFNVCFYDDLHNPDYVRIFSPAPGSVFNYGDPIYISVGIQDNCGVWFAGGIDLYADGSPLTHLDTTFDFVWQNAPPGPHSILARSTSNDWLEDSVGITVVVPGNQAPTVAITSPADGAVFNIGADIPIHVTAQDSDGSVVQIQLLIFGPDGATITSDDADLDYTFHSTAPGVYSLTATATDNAGVTATGTVIHITYAAPPTVVITSPPEGAVFSVGADVPVHVASQDPGGWVVQIQLTDGTTTFTTNATDFDYTFTSLAAGNYTLMASATDNFGMVGTTSVHITVGNPRPANDDFANSFDLAQVTTGNNANATREPGEPINYGGGHSVWWHYTAPSDGMAVFSTAGSSFANGIAIYTGNSLNNLHLVTWYYDFVNHQPAIVWFNLIAGTTYYIDVDGLGNAAGDIQLSVHYDVPPTFTITTPTDGLVFTAPADVPVHVTAQDSDGTVAQINLNLVALSDGTTTSFTSAGADLDYIFHSLPAGNYQLIVRVTDNLGITIPNSVVFTVGN